MGGRESARSEMPWVLGGDGSDGVMGSWGREQGSLQGESDWLKIGLTWSQGQDS